MENDFSHLALPASHTIDHNNRSISIFWHGEINSDMLCRALHHYRRQIRVGQLVGYSELVDFTAASGSGFKYSDIRYISNLAQQTDNSQRTTRLAIVAGSSLAYGLARMYATFRQLNPCSNREVMVFRNIGKARAWLGDIHQ